MILKRAWTLLIDLWRLQLVKLQQPDVDEIEINLQMSESFGFVDIIISLIK